MQVHRVDLDTVDGFGASFVTYGATLVSLRCADKLGSIEEVMKCDISSFLTPALFIHEHGGWLLLKVVECSTDDSL